MARINLDDDELATIAQCFAQVEDMLNSHGITVVKDRELTSVLAGALIQKVRDGETDRRKLVGHANMKAWAHLWSLDGHLIEASPSVGDVFEARRLHNTSDIS